MNIEAEDLDTYVKRMEEYNIRKEQRTKYRNNFIACYVFIRQRISEESMQRILAVPEHSQSIQQFNMGKMRRSIKSATIPNGNQKNYMIASACRS